MHACARRGDGQQRRTRRGLRRLREAGERKDRAAARERTEASLALGAQVEYTGAEGYGEREADADDRDRTRDGGGDAGARAERTDFSGERAVWREAEHRHHRRKVKLTAG